MGIVEIYLLAKAARKIYGKVKAKQAEAAIAKSIPVIRTMWDRVNPEYKQAVHDLSHSPDKRDQIARLDERIQRAKSKSLRNRLEKRRLRLLWEVDFQTHHLRILAALAESIVAVKAKGIATVIIQGISSYVESLDGYYGLVEDRKLFEAAFIFGVLRFLEGYATEVRDGKQDLLCRACSHKPSAIAGCPLKRRAEKEKKRLFKKKKEVDIPQTKK